MVIDPVGQVRAKENVALRHDISCRLKRTGKDYKALEDSIRGMSNQALKEFLAVLMSWERKWRLTRSGNCRFKK